MTTTQISKHQILDYVTKREFNDFVEEVRDFRDITEIRFDTIDKRFEAIDKRFDTIDNRFEAIDNRFEAIDKRFEVIDNRLNTIDTRLGGIDKRLNTFDRKFDELKEVFRIHTGALHERFREDLRIGLEYIQNVDHKKVDLIEFEKLKEKVNIILSYKTKSQD